MIKKILNRFKKIIFPLSRKKIIILIVLIILSTGGIVVLQRNMQSKPLEFTQVKRNDVRTIVSASGTLNGKNTTDLKFKSGGKVAFVNVKVGDRVTSEEVIAGLDTQDLSLKLQLAQNSLADKEANLQKTLDDIHLFQYGNGGFGNIGTANETGTQRQTRISAEAAKNNAYDSVKEAQRAFQDSVITTPFDGVITQVKVVPGQIVGGDLIATVSDDSTIFFDGDVDQADISKVHVGQNVTLSLDSYPEKSFNGQVSEIAGQTKTTGNNATVILVRIALSNFSENFISGLTGQASITVAEAKSTLTLPLEAIKEDNSVVTEEGNKFKNQKVEVGIKSDTDVEIKSGLKEGEKVLLNPPANFNFRNMQNPLTRILRLPGGGPRGRQAN